MLETYPVALPPARRQQEHPTSASTATIEARRRSIEFEVILKQVKAAELYRSGKRARASNNIFPNPD
jgi:hypothetical protein